MKRSTSILLALVLAVGMVLGVSGLALADEVKPVTISILRSYEDWYAADYDDESEANKYFLDTIKDLVPGYEISLEYWMYENNEKQIPLLLASGDLPDIVVSNGLNYIEYIQTGYFRELTDLLNDYGPDILANIDPASWELTKVGDEIWGVPQENYNYKYPTAIRVDWLKKHGLEVKDTYTLSELTDILYAFSTDGAYGLGARPCGGGEWKTTFMPIFGAFGGQPDQFYIDDNVAYPWNVSQEFRDSLTYLAQLYKDGVVDPECFILNTDQALIKAANGDVGVYTGWWNVVRLTLEAGVLDIDPDAEFKHIYITSDDGTKAGMLDNGLVYRMGLISSECEYPELAMAVINYCYTMEGEFLTAEENLPPDMDYWYENGFDYVEGAPQTRENRIYRFPNHWQHSALADRFAAGYRYNPMTGLFHSLNYRITTAMKLEPVGPEDPVAYWNYVGGQFQLNLENHPVYTSVFYTVAPTAAVLEYTAGLDTYLQQWVVDFITGVKELNDATWQEYLDGYVAKGLQKVLDSYVEEYNKIQGTDIAALKIN